MVVAVLAVAAVATLMYRFWNFIMEPDPQPRSSPSPPYTPTLSHHSTTHSFPSTPTLSHLSTTHRPIPSTPTLKGPEGSDHNTTWPEVVRGTTTTTTTTATTSSGDNSMYDCGRTDEKIPFLYIPPIPANAKLTMSFPETRHALRTPLTDSSSSSYSCAEAASSGSCRTKEDNTSSFVSSFASWKTAPPSVPYSTVTSDSWKTAPEFCDENHSPSSSINEHTSTTVPSAVSAPSWKKRIAKSLTSVSSSWKTALGFKVGTPSEPTSCTTSQEFDGATPSSSCDWLIGEEFEYTTEASGLCRERESHTSSSSSSSGDNNNTNRRKKLYGTTDSPMTSSTSPHQDRADRDDIKATLEVLVTAIHRLPSLQQPHQQQHQHHHQYESIIDNITR
ncbi:hypothetical protein Pmani_002510 [Petrolisthes manimaculis]|uniref:Uncharacterized protein n=1 Tax=Petrolisthes manimaculis TaxID=1843537 RepID=A0AAE1QKA9_9EUCA|nr:hypothetical protein Pmani_002510 [Petrolisthes manimaculis]